MPTITQDVVRAARARGLTVLTRDQWGAVHEDVYAWRRENKPHALLPGRPVDTMWQHITVTLDHGPLTGDFKADVRTIERIGYDRFRSGISYTWVVDMRTGMIAQGMPLDAKGTHTVNAKGIAGFSYDQNAVALSIAVLGMPSDRLSSVAENAIAQLLAAHIDAGVLTRTFDYVPHSLVAAKDCPCDATRNRMDEIRAAALKATEPPEPDRPPARVHLQQASLRFDVRPRALAPAVSEILGRGAAIVHFTEAGGHADVLARTCKERGYQIAQPTHPDDPGRFVASALAVRNGVKLVDVTFTPVVPAQPGRARDGGHDVRGVLTVNVVVDGVELHVSGVHIITGWAREDDENLTPRGQQILEQWETTTALAAELGAGRDLSILMGDVNYDPDDASPDLPSDLLAEHGWTSVLDEVGRPDHPTHGRRTIDQIYTLDADRRVSVARVKVWPPEGPTEVLDHRQVSAVVEIRHPTREEAPNDVPS